MKIFTHLINSLLGKIMYQSYLGISVGKYDFLRKRLLKQFGKK